MPKSKETIKAVLKDVTKEALVCALCGAEQPRLRMGLSKRSFGVREGESRVHVSTNGEEPVCLDMRGCFQRAVTKGLDDAVPVLERSEAERLARVKAEGEANKLGETTYRHTSRTVRGKVMARR